MDAETNKVRTLWAWLESERVYYLTAEKEAIDDGREGHAMWCGGRAHQAYTTQIMLDNLWGRENTH